MPASKCIYILLKIHSLQGVSLPGEMIRHINHAQLCCIHITIVLASLDRKWTCYVRVVGVTFWSLWTPY